MREILFKAKERHSHKWVEGYYVKRGNMTFIYPAIPEVVSRSLAKEIRPNHSVKSTQKKIKEVFLVDPETVCQYTGLTDKNGAKIFEGDKLSDKYGDTGVVKFGWSYGACGFFCEGVVDDITDNDLLVIGNIYDKEADHED